MRSPKLLLPWDAWPEADRRAWEAAVRPGDVLEDGGPASHWAPRTKRTILYGYRRWLGHLAINDPDQLTSAPMERIHAESIRNYVETLDASITPAGTFNYVKHLYYAARVMGPERDWAWLGEIARRLEQRVVPTNKRPRMVSASRLFELGIELMTKAEQADDMVPRTRALLYRDGLIIALLAARPFRRRTFAVIEIGTSLVRVGDGYALVFSPDETKNHRAVETFVPGVLVPYVESYLTAHRPNIFGAGSHQGLWASAKGRPMTEEAIYERVCLHTRDAFGRSINPHLFRDCLATEIAIEDPVNVRIAADMLGHISLETTERYYIQAASLEIGRKHQAGIVAMRERLSEHKNPTNRKP